MTIEWRGYLISLPQSQAAQHRLLFSDQRLHSLARVGHHLRKLSFVEGLALSGRLHFVQFLYGKHHEINVHLGARVFFVTEIEQNFSIHNPHAHGGNEIS